MEEEVDLAPLEEAMRQWEAAGDAMSPNDKMLLFESAFKGCIGKFVEFRKLRAQGKGSRRLNPNKSKKAYQSWFDHECRQAQLKLFRVRRT
jgi:hypothetical protein